MAWRAWAVVAVALNGAAFAQQPDRPRGALPNYRTTWTEAPSPRSADAVTARPQSPFPTTRRPAALPAPSAVQSLMRQSTRRPVAAATYPTAVPTLAPPVPPFAAALRPAVAEAVRADTQGFADDLANALRPSVRETAATGLAEGRHGWRPEVKRLLAQAAMTDPAVSVRVHCVGLLASLGYHEPEYVDFLRSATDTGPDRLKQAARLALAKLAPR